MRRKAVLSALVVAVLVLAAGLVGTALGKTDGATGTTQETTQQAYAPHINPSDFTTKIDNKYFPLKPGTTFVY
jgi:archaellin